MGECEGFSAMASVCACACVCLSVCVSRDLDQCVDVLIMCLQCPLRRGSQQAGAGGTW